MKHSLGKRVYRWFKNLIRNSKYRWLVILGSLVYLISPIDISPDVFPIIGWIDDGLLASVVITELTQMVIDQRRKKAGLTPKHQATETANSVIDVESAPVN